MSLRKIRQTPPPIRNAYAACVRIITPYWHGAGVMISPDGLILTSYHLVAGVPCASVQTMDGRIFPVTHITSASAIHDLALIRIPGGPYVPLGISKEDRPAEGSAIRIVGHPGDATWHSVTGLSLRCRPDRGTVVLHFDAPVARGNSGGPVVNDRGDLVALTACSAELADGANVKVGIAAPAIRKFLASPSQPMAFADLSRIERNRRLTDFLGQICLLMDVWINDWLDSVSRIRIEEATRDPNPAFNRRIHFAQTQQTAEISARLILLKAMLIRCRCTKDMDPELEGILAESSLALDALLDGALLLSGKATLSPDDSRVAMEKASHCRKEANQHFAKALAGLQSTASRLELTAADPLRYEQLSAIQSRQKSVGCRVEP